MSGGSVGSGPRVAYLADHPEALSQLEAWFLAEWPEWYGPGGRGDARADLRAYASRHELPVGLVAFEGDELVGLMVLKAESIASRPQLGPWAAAGLVRQGRRRQGVGAGLLRALEGVARGLGFSRIHCGTATASTLLERAGWRYLEHADAHGEAVAIYEKGLVDPREGG